MLFVDKTYEIALCFKRFFHWIFWYWSSCHQSAGSLHFLRSFFFHILCIFSNSTLSYETWLLFYFAILLLFTERFPYFHLFSKHFLARCFDFPLNAHRLCHFAQRTFGPWEIRIHTWDSMYSSPYSAFIIELPCLCVCLLWFLAADKMIPWYNVYTVHCTCEYLRFAARKKFAYGF